MPADGCLKYQRPKFSLSAATAGTRAADGLRFDLPPVALLD